jgi:hypothetical protein
MFEPSNRVESFGWRPAVCPGCGLEQRRLAYEWTPDECLSFLKVLLDIGAEFAPRNYAKLCRTPGAFESPSITRVLEHLALPHVPAIAGNILREIDAIVGQASCTGWPMGSRGDESVRFELRRALRKFGLPPSGEFYECAYGYVAAHY